VVLVVAFLGFFADRLYHRNRKPLQLILDEADAFAPQTPMPDERRMLGAIERIVRRGRARGLGVTLITQRPAVLNKNVLTQIEVLVTLRMTGPQDRKAIEAWISAYGSQQEGDELIASLADLPVGTAWFWSPAWLQVFRKVQIRRRETFDSSATPKVGSAVIQPRAFAEVDLAAIRERMSALIEQAQTDDPRDLRRRIHELEKQLAKRQPVEPQVKTVEVPVVTEEQLDTLASRATDALSAAADLRTIADALITAVWQVREAMGGRYGRAVEMAKAVTAADASVPVSGVAPQSADVTRPQQRILSVLREMEALGLQEMVRGNLAVFAEQSPTSSGYTNNLGRLRTLGLIDYPRSGYVRLTDSGRARTPVCLQAHTLEDLHRAWLSRLARPRAAILSEAIRRHPAPIAKAELASEANQSPTSSGYTNNLGALRSLGLIDYPQPGYVVATELLFPEGLQ
jgi:hypothetical protein